MNKERTLQKHLSPAVAWAFAVGTAIGWGSLVVTANTYLAQAGPMGSVLGLVLGALIMVVIAVNYAYLMRAFPEAGGAYAYTREAFGYDFAFLTAWFLAMTYFAVLWANVTSLPLYGRIFMGGLFRVGKLYTIFGYEVYLGEVLLSMAALLVTGYLCMRHEKLVDVLMIALALLFTVGIAACFIGAFAGGGRELKPLYLPDSAELSQIVKIAVISPWAFIGFESISHGVEEFRFDHRRIPRLMLVVVVMTLVLYVMVTLLSVTAYPERYDSWLSYIRDLDSLEGLEALPAFYAANRFLGSFGVWALMLSLLGLVITSLIGNTFALSRLFFALGRDKVLPKKLAELNDRNVPANAVGLVIAVSFLIPLIGRTAIGWIVDVTTIGATLIYALVSAAAAKLAKQDGNRAIRFAGTLGLGLMLAFGAYILLPNLLLRSSMARETYFLFIAWSVLGFLFFRYILRIDTERRFGNSLIVWVALQALVLFVSLIWMRQSMIVSNDTLLDNIHTYYEEHDDLDGQRTEDERYVELQLESAKEEDARTMVIAVGMVSFTLFIMLTNHLYMNRRAKESDHLANIDPMTGVKSKLAFLNSEKKFDEAIANGSVEKFAVAVCDVNGLKKINDTLGHKAGDEYIRSASRLVCDIFQHSPVFRVGGDEFVVILTGRDYLIRKELLLTLHDRSVANISKEGAVVVSGGFSSYKPGEDRSFHEVFERADTLMYEEKQLLKGLGSVTRDDSEAEAHPAVPLKQDGADVLSLSRHVLIVEDEVPNQMMLGMMLEAEGYELLYADDGVEALEQLKLHHDDLAIVLLDLQMPKMTGMDVLRVMKEEEEFRKIPVIILTADQSAEVECLKIGAMDFIPKPYPSPEIVQARVRRCIDLAEKQDIIQSTERDSLTRLYNVDYFMNYVRMYDQHYADMPMDAMVIDVNSFHMINERYGRQHGDRVLSRLGEQIRIIAREVGGVACRRGADAFLIYCPHREDYEALLEKASDGLKEGEATPSRVRLRMGVYAQVDKHLEVNRRFDYAKIAANTVKNSYLKSVGVYDQQMHDAELYRARLLEDFRPALQEHCFKVFFQPKFNVRTATPVLIGAESLVRWQHPELGFISPGVFIPLLEDNGLILELDRYVWREAAERIRDWKQRFGFCVPVSVNVSRVDMLTPNLKGIFTEILSSCGLQPEDLILEVTESAYTEDSEQILSTAHELRKMGLRIEMDDFGTGYSSLGMLSNLPLDALKLDMSFVRSAFGEAKDLRMIELIIDIADYLSVPVVAEGVETEEQYLALKALGCDAIQGYYFSKPVPPEEFDRFFKERETSPVPTAPEYRQSYISLSKALAGDFERIFYVDTQSGRFLEFRAEGEHELEILPGGTDFFDEPEKLLPGAVCEEDRPRIGAALGRESLAKWAETDEPQAVRFRRADDEARKAFVLQTVRTRNRDDRHLVIGVRPDPDSSASL